MIETVTNVLDLGSWRDSSAHRFGRKWFTAAAPIHCYEHLLTEASGGSPGLSAWRTRRRLP